MLQRRKVCLTAGAAAIIPIVLFAAENVDLAVIHRIKAEAFEHSKVMDDMFYLTDVHGPRLTGSPNFKAAGDWAVARLKDYGLVNVREEKWGPFGRGWQNKHFEAALVEPQYAPLIGLPLAWTASTDGTVTGEPILVNIRTEADFDKYKGKLKGKIVMTQPAKEIGFVTTPLGRRYTSDELAEEEQAQMPGPSALGPRRGNFPGIDPNMTPEERRKAMAERRQLQEKIAEFFKNEGALVQLSYGYNGDGGTVFASSGGSYDLKKPVAIAAVAITPEHYNRIARLMQHDIPVKLSFNIQNQIVDQNQDSFNITGEIPGNAKKDEIVMVGGHFDSWHGGTGATDNAAGSAVAMEAVRILKTLDLKMDRTRADCIVGRRGRGAAGVEGLCERALRGSGDDESDSGAR